MLERKSERENAIAVTMSKFNELIVDSSTIAVLTLYQDINECCAA